MTNKIFFDALRALKANDAASEQAIMDMIDAGAELDIADPFGWTPLTLAVDAGSLRVVTAMLQKGAALDDKQEDGYTPLMLSIRHQHQEIFDLLLKAGADKDEKGPNNDTPLMLAAEKRNQGMMLSLISAGANIHLTGGDMWSFGRTALSYALNFNCEDAALALIARGASIKQTGFQDNPLPCVAAHWGMVRVMHALIDKGIDLNMRGKGHTLLSLGAEHPDMVKLLVTAGARLTDVDDRQQDLLQIITAPDLKDWVINNAPQDCQIAKMQQGIMTKGKVPLVARIKLKR